MENGEEEMTPEEWHAQVSKAADVVAAKLDADVLFINAEFARGGVDKEVTQTVTSLKRRRKSVVAIIVSEGGDASAAYKVARTLQRCYKKFIALVPGWCKSAGTLCVLGAHELVMADDAELGPLDVQMRKKDELGESSSGLVVAGALESLQGHMFAQFQQFMLEIKNRSMNVISFKLASEIASKMAVSAMEPIYRQIDPLQIGEYDRYLKVAKDYGLRLTASGKNMTKENLLTLINTYPSHDFVIDRREAGELFSNVRTPHKEELELLALLDEMLEPQPSVCVGFFSNEQVDANEQQTQSTGSATQSAIPKVVRKAGDAGNTGGAAAA